MPIIRSISDLRNHANEISKLCHKSGEPVFITKNGQGDIVVMSQALFEKQMFLFELYKKLDESERDFEADDKGIPHKKVISRLRRKL